MSVVCNLSILNCLLDKVNYYMKKFLLFISVVIIAASAMAQPSWFYSGTRQLDEEQLKKVLQERIDNRIGLSEDAVKELSKKYNRTGNNNDNVLLFYTKTTSRKLDVPADNAGSWSISDYLNSKRGTGDILNIRQVESGSSLEKLNNMSVSSTKSQSQVFKNSQLVDEFSMMSDSMKGEIARMIFYSELQKNNPDIHAKTEENLKVADGFTVEDWKTLLEWNNKYPPNNRETKLNQNAYSSQNVRNPFVDNPNFANKIWNYGSDENISFGDITQSPLVPKKDDTVDISTPIFVESGTVNQVTLTYGLSYDANTYSQSMEDKNQVYSAKLKLTGIEETETMFYRIIAVSDSDTSSVSSDFTVPKDIHSSEIDDIGAVQGLGLCSDIIGEHTYVTGRVTGNLDRTWYLQSGEEKRSGIAIDGNLFRGQVGDSVILGGYVFEKNGVTSISDLTYTFNYHRPIPYKPLEVSIKELKNSPEDYESMLIRIPEVKFLDDKSQLPKAGGKTMISSARDEEYSISIKIDSAIDLAGKTYPNGIVDVQGILSEDGDEYFIIPRTFSDLNIKRDTVAPKITDLSFDKTNAMLRVKYSEPIEVSSATNPESYEFVSKLTRAEYVRLDDSKRIATLLLSNVPEKEMTFTARGVEDLAGNKAGGVEYSVNVPVSTKDHNFSMDYNGDDVQLSKSAFKHNELQVKSKGLEISKIEIYSMVGDKLIEYPVDAFSTTININNLGKGMYIADIFLDNNSKVSRKFVKD